MSMQCNDKRIGDGQSSAVGRGLRNGWTEGGPSLRACMRAGHCRPVWAVCMQVSDSVGDSVGWRPRLDGVMSY